MTNEYTYFPAGQVSNVSSVAGSMTYAYDAAERLTNLTDSLAGSFDYAYNEYNGLVDTVSFPNGIECSYYYDEMDRIRRIEYVKGGTDLEDIGYVYNDATGMIINRSRESQNVLYETEYTYDTLDRLTGENLRDATGAVLDTATYMYDLAGNRTNKTRNGVSVEYTLGSGNLISSWSASGAISAVIAVSGSSTETVGTDPRFGERTINDLQAEAVGTNFWHPSIPLTTGEVDLVAVIGDLAGNVGRDTNTITVTIVTEASYGYDAAGNVTNISYNSGDIELDLVWNAQYQLTFATDGTVIESYGYDAPGRRIATITGTTTNYHVYDGIHCIADVDHEGDLVRSYTYGPGIDNILAITVHGSSETNTYYYLTDHLGSVIAITDTNGAVVETYDYDAWGRTAVYDTDNLPLSESAIGNRIAFQGREISWATGLYYFRARWYDPVTGRWLSKDPIGISGGLNQYVAFNNNPVIYWDSTGLGPESGPSLTKLVGNSINNRVTAINEATGTVLADLYNRTASSFGLEQRTDFGQQYSDLVDLANSAETPANPEGTPYIVAGLTVSACAVTTAVAAEAGLGRLLFGKGGLLNRGPNFRIGYGRKGGERVFRIAGDWVKKIIPSGKIDLWRGGPL